MDFIKKNKNVLMLIGVLLLALAAYWYWQSGNNGNEPPLSASPPQTTASLAGQDILNLLNQLRSIQIDSSVFENPAFKSLVDYRIATTAEPLGRPDPFEPLPFEVQKQSSQH